VPQLSVSVLALVALTAVSWLVLLEGSMLGDSIGTFIVAWLVMMTAMMLPAAIPMILVFRLVAMPGRLTDSRTVLSVTGYLVVWTGLGVAAFAAQSTFMSLERAVQVWFAVGVLSLAGAYQFSPLKDTCLRACRSPMDFVVLHWRSGASGAFRVGIAHGLYCLGCCWALMAVLVVAGGMGLAWVAAIGLVVFVEKVLPRGRTLSRFVGAGMLAAAASIAVWPELLLIATGKM